MTSVGGAGEEDHVGIVGAVLAHGHRSGQRRGRRRFGGMLMTATFSLFPLLGRTPPPWRWKRDVLATSLGTHPRMLLGWR